MKQRVTIYWLIPAKPERDLFGDVIAILAGQLAAPRFEPHLTLCKAEHERAAAATLRQLKSKPLKLRVRDVSHSSKFTQTLIVQFTPTSALQRLIRQLGGSKRLDNPHISLIYKKIPASTRKGLAGVVHVPFRAVTFDAIKAVSCVSPTETTRDVESWRAIATKRLVG